jgi:hypothetical protein
MMMKCVKCGGRVFVDRVFSQLTSVECYCILCGKRWMIDKESSRFGRWLEKKESENKKAYGISS